MKSNAFRSEARCLLSDFEGAEIPLLNLCIVWRFLYASLALRRRSSVANFPPDLCDFLRAVLRLDICWRRFSLAFMGCVLLPSSSTAMRHGLPRRTAGGARGRRVYGRWRHDGGDLKDAFPTSRVFVLAAVCGKKTCLAME